MVEPEMTEVNQLVIEKAVGAVLPEGLDATPAVGGDAVEVLEMPVGVSGRHVHLSRADMDVLFGPGSDLTHKKDLKQPGQFAAEETVTLQGPKGKLAKVRVLGPLRPETQIEVSVADGFALGVTPPMRLSGKLGGTPGVEIVGPAGTVKKDAGVIVAQRHIHILPDMASRFGLKNGDEVDIRIGGDRGGVLSKVVVRAVDKSALELHVDMEEANAFFLHNDDVVALARR
jgi:putative phosphotransacetylase